MTFRPSRRDSAVALGALLAGAAVAAAVAAAAWPSSAASGAAKPGAGSPVPSASSSSPVPAGSSSSLTPVPDAVGVTLRPREIMLPSQDPYTSGKIVLLPLRMTCGLSTIIGTHGEELANGQYCRIRVAITDNDSETHNFDASKTVLTTTAGTTIGVSNDANLVKRQPDKFAPVGSHDRYEFDMWFDVPRDVTVNGFTFVGDNDQGAAPPVHVPLPVRDWPFS